MTTFTHKPHLVWWLFFGARKFCGDGCDVGKARSGKRSIGVKISPHSSMCSALTRMGWIKARKWFQVLNWWRNSFCYRLATEFVPPSWSSSRRKFLHTQVWNRHRLKAHHRAIHFEQWHKCRESAIVINYQTEALQEWKKKGKTGGNFWHRFSSSFNSHEGNNDVLPSTAPIPR